MTAPTSSKGLALIKASVIVMGVLIVLGMIGLAYGLIAQGNRGRTTAAIPAATLPANAATVPLGLPAATQLRAMSLTERNVALHLAIPGQGEWVYVVPLTGEGRILKIAIGAGETKP